MRNPYAAISRVSLVILFAACLAANAAGVDTFPQQARLAASDGGAADEFGKKVSIDGDLVAVGAPAADDGRGAVYIFVRPDGAWRNATEVAKLTASDATDFHQLGSAVSISGDTVVAGARGANLGGPGARGAIYVFVRPESGWVNGTETAKVTLASASSADNIGEALAIDGASLVTGVHRKNGIHPGGRVYLYQRPAGGWTNMTEATALLTASDGADFDSLGSSVTIRDSVIAAGAPGDDSASFVDHGSVYVYVRPSGGWVDAVETAKLTASDGRNRDVLGTAVSVDGGVVVASALGDDINGVIGQGSTYVFEESPTGWMDSQETAKLTASDGADFDSFGWSIAQIGDTVVVGARHDDIGNNGNQGAAYIFRRPVGGWTDVQETVKLLVEGGDAGDLAGWSVALGVGTDGETAVLGTPYGGVGGIISPGTVQIYTLSSFVFADGFESGDLHAWSAATP